MQEDPRLSRRDDRRDYKEDYGRRERRSESRREDPRRDYRRESRRDEHYRADDHHHYRGADDRRDDYYRNEERRRHHDTSDRHHRKRDSFDGPSLHNDDGSHVLPIDEWPRRLKNWDVPPVGFEGMTSEQVKATGLFIPASAQPKVTNLTPFAEAQPRLGFLSAGHDTSMNSANAPSNMSSTNRRCIVSGFPADWSDAQLLSFLTDLFQSYGIVSSSGASKIIQKIHLIPEKEQALVDFVDPGMAGQALIFDGYVWEGGRYVLHVRKPKEALLPTDDVSSQGGVLPTSETISHHVADTPAKLFIGCIPFSLNEQDIMDLLQSFGPLKSFHLVRDNQGHSKGYAFCEYQDPLVTDTACAGLHQFELLDKKLVVQRASQGKLSNAGTTGAATSGTSFGPMIVGSVGIQANVSTYATVASSLLPSLTKNLKQPPQPSPILQILNVMDLQSPLLTHDEYCEWLLDIIQECQKFGTVLSAFLARPHVHEAVVSQDILIYPFTNSNQRVLSYDTHGSNTELNNLFPKDIEKIHIPSHAWGKAFIQFEKKVQSATAMDALAGRKFGDNIVLTSYYSYDLYKNLDFN